MFNKMVSGVWLKLMAISLKWMRLETICDHLLMPGLLNSQSTIVDIGGNIGKFSLDMKNRFQSSIYIAEPDPRNFEKIPKVPGIHKFNLAISDKRDNIIFYVSENPEASSFNEMIARRWGIADSIRVNAFSYQEFIIENNIVKADLIKIDAEGSEIEIIKSMTIDDLSKVNQITVEFHDFLDTRLHTPTLEVIRHMMSLGFAVIISSHHTFSHVLFLNKKIIDKLSFWAGYMLHSIIRKRII